VKRAESGTGVLAFAVADETGVTAIATLDGQLGDPNWDADHPYVARVLELANTAATIDLHMMRPRGMEWCLGLGPVPPLSDELRRILLEEADAAGLRTTLNWPFSAGWQTVTGKLQRAGRPAIQLEMSIDCFDRRQNTMARAWSALLRAVTRIAATQP
jgi:hypothetical protein